MAKRLFDLVVGAIGLLLLAPLMGVIALTVCFDSEGPALFGQVRVTRSGRHFRMLKFRSMHVGQPADGSYITVAGDPRITRVGAFLRRSKLDELPQLINVIKGDMSFVGPRPEVPRYVALYPPALRNLVLSVRAGITDDASLEFSNESDLLARAPDPEKQYIEKILPRKLEIYASYARQHTFLGDMCILLRTLGLLARRNAGH